MKAIKIGNLRSIKNSDYIMIKSLNIILGKNSSGKSTFIRTFPLLKQSIRRRLRGPILWFDSSFVDFGDYEIAKNKYADKKDHIQFGFNISLDKAKIYSSVRNIMRYPSRLNHIVAYNLPSEIFIELSINKDPKGSFVNKIEVIINKDIIKLEIKSRNDQVTISINNESLITSYPIKLEYALTQGIIPFILPIKKENTHIYDFPLYIMENLISKIKIHCNKRLTDMSKIHSLLLNVNRLEKKDLLKYLKEQDIISSFGKKIKDWDIDTPEFNEIYDLWLLLQIPYILDIANNEIRFFFGNSSYIAPTRAEAMRFYRNQELEVSEVDAYGRNLQEFISSLSDKQLSDLQNFMLETIGVKAFISNTMSHQSINIQDKKKQYSFNLTDVGFGYSQILPIITKLWDHTRRKLGIEYRRNNNICIAIEQPELHLHPAMQAIIADAFLLAITKAKENGINLQIIIETHSPTIVNRIGRRVAEKKINQENIQLILFDKDEEMKNSVISTTHYNENGKINNWPLGFFEP